MFVISATLRLIPIMVITALGVVLGLAVVLAQRLDFYVARAPACARTWPRLPGRLPQPGLRG